jgi:hypothetical protein
MDALLYLSALYLWAAIAALAIGGGFLLLCCVVIEDACSSGLGPRG